MRYDSYIICTAPRSGSTLLCRLLTDCGVAGRPDSYFYEPSVADWMEELGIPPGNLPETEAIRAVIAAAMVRGRGTTPLFGLRQQRSGFGFLCDKLRQVSPAGLSDRHCLEHVFGRILFIHLSREDKLAQAVSLIKAEQSGLWHVAADGSELERSAPHQPPVYDARAIRTQIDALTEQDAGWRDWFTQQGIAPLRLTYDALSAAPVDTLRSVLTALGLDPAHADPVRPGVRKLADRVSEDWIARFRAEERFRDQS
ncbi:Stf0 family sulfotransferase [Pseudotabrizicola sp. 4114]|uniref:Stf0 family sulfotransferase n=1 Tax=Pseudotabrizicola sp. 4114 TaxID=2817731 RepID=UPI002857D8E6|nr:LPS sulfotransferase NodH [Pseudorhodobacter sp. 4114]